MNTDKTLCPLCGTEVAWHVSNPTYKKDKDTTHIYICPECPFVGLEYHDNKNLKDLIAYLNR